MRLFFLVVCAFSLLNAQAQTKPKDLQAFMAEAGVKPTEVIAGKNVSFCLSEPRYAQDRQEKYARYPVAKIAGRTAAVAGCAAGLSTDAIYLESKDQ